MTNTINYDALAKVLEQQEAIRKVRVAKSELFYLASGPETAKFGQALRVLRKLRNLKQEELAKLCGYTQPRWSAIENNKIIPAPHNVFKIEKALDLVPGSLSQILGYLPATSEDSDREEKK